MIKDLPGNGYHIEDDTMHLLDISKCSFGESQFLPQHFLSDFVEILRMVANTLQVVEHMEVGADHLLIALLNGGGQFDEESGQGAVSEVNNRLVFDDFRLVLHVLGFHSVKGGVMAMQCVS